MNDRLTLQRLRAFLRGLTVALFVGTVVELLLAKHTESPMQLVPFGLCGLGLLALLLAWTYPRRWSLQVLRATMLVVALGGVVGSIQHFQGNREFVLETKPRADMVTLLSATLTGRDPLLAPGILAVAAALAVATTYAAEPESATAKATAARASGNRVTLDHRAR